MIPAMIAAEARANPLVAIALVLFAGWAIYVIVKSAYDKKYAAAQSSQKMASVKREVSYYLDKQRHPMCKIELDRKDWRRFRPGKTLEHIDPSRLELFVQDAEFDAYCYDRLQARYLKFKANKKHPRRAVRRACLDTYRYALYRMGPGIDVAWICRGRRGRQRSEFMPLVDAHAWLCAIWDFKGHPNPWLDPVTAFQLLMKADYKCGECGAEPDAGSPVTASLDDGGKPVVLCGRCRALKFDEDIRQEAARSVQEIIRRKKAALDKE